MFNILLKADHQLLKTVSADKVPDNNNFSSTISQKVI